MIKANRIYSIYYCFHDKENIYFLYESEINKLMFSIEYKRFEKMECRLFSMTLVIDNGIFETIYIDLRKLRSYVKKFDIIKNIHIIKLKDVTGKN